MRILALSALWIGLSGLEGSGNGELQDISGSMLIANIMFFIMGLFGAKLFARVPLIPNTLLWPSVIVLSVVGAYSLDQSMLEVWIMIGSGLVGCVIRHFGFSVVPVAGPDSRRAGGGR